jgi:hypothetical protein
MLPSTLALTLVLGLAVVGCATYRGQYDPTIPMSSQSTLTILGGYSIWIQRFDGRMVEGFMNFFDTDMTINIPAGEHTITLVETYEDRYGNYQHRQFDVTIYFEAGCQYETTSNGGIRKISDGQPQDVYVRFEPHGGVHFGTGLNGWIGLDYKLGFIFDAETIMETHLDIGGNYYDSEENHIPLSVNMALMYEYYFPGTSFGLGVGGGIITPDFFRGYVPYAKAYVIPLRNILGIGKANVYFDYYFLDAAFGKPDFDKSYLSTWGIGIELVY